MNLRFRALARGSGVLVSLLAASLACGCTADAADDAATSDDALNVVGAATDNTFGSGGELDAQSALSLAPDGSFASAHDEGGFLVLERRTKDGAPLASFSSATARIAHAKLARPRAAWSPAAPTERTILCETGVEPNGVTYAVGYVKQKTPQGHPTYSGFVVITSADGSKVGGFAEGLGIPDYGWAKELPMCLSSVRTGDGHLLVQFGVERESMAGIRAIVPLDPTAHSLDAPGSFDGDPHVTGYSSYRTNNVFAGPAFALGDGRMVTGLKDAYHYTPTAGFSIDRVEGMSSSGKRVRVPFRSLRVDDSSISLLTEGKRIVDPTIPVIDSRVNYTFSYAIESYDFAGTKKMSISVSPLDRPADTTPTAAVRDSSGRMWVVLDAPARDAASPLKRFIIRYRADGTRDAAFGTAALTGPSAEPMLTAQVQGTNLLVGTKIASGYHYVRLK